MNVRKTTVKAARASALVTRLERLSSELKEVQREVAALVVHEEWTSLELPPDVRSLRNGRRVFAETCRGIVSAYREGHVWHVSRADWVAARRRHARAPASPVPPEPLMISEADLVIASAGYRPTRRLES